MAVKVLVKIFTAFAMEKFERSDLNFRYQSSYQDLAYFLF